MPRTHKRDESITLVCSVCGGEYHPRRDRLNTSTVCSAACGMRLGASITNRAASLRRVQRECPQCLNAFYPAHREQRFCSPECARRYGRPGLDARPCPACGQPFIPTRSRQVYCSLACSYRHPERAKHPRKERPPQECQYCHKPFIPKRLGRVFCSPLCQRGAALTRIRHSGRNTPESNERRRLTQLQRINDGTHPFLRKRKEASGSADAGNVPITDTPAQMPEQSRPEVDEPTPDLPPLPALPDTAIEEEAEAGQPLTLPLIGAEARNLWRGVGELREMQADRALRQDKTRAVEGRTIILAGQGSYIGVQGGALVVHQGRTHGVPAPARELLYPAMHGVQRIIWIGAHGHMTGTLTLAATAWCQREGVHLCALDGSGLPLLELAPSDAPHDAELRRRQWLISSGIALPDAPSASSVVHEIVARKVAGQRRTLAAHPELPGQTAGLALLDTWLEWMSIRAKTAHRLPIDYVRKLEGRLAVAYFRAWEGWPLQWGKPDAKRVPPHWLTCRPRNSPLSPSGNTRHAVDPLNACVNYAYGCLASQRRQSLLSAGFDLAGAFLHADKARRDSLTYDLMELERASVDDLVLSFLGRTTLHVGDFAREASGQVSLHPQLTRLLLAECRVPQARVDAHARWLRRILNGEDAAAEALS